MSLVEFLADKHAEIPIQIFGTDLSETAIQRARMGLYKESIETDVSPIRLRRFSPGCRASRHSSSPISASPTRVNTSGGCKAQESFPAR